VHPPPAPAWANFTLMIKCTPESDCCYSVYSVAQTLSPQRQHQNRLSSPNVVLFRRLYWFFGREREGG
jgi:hypothetical protein